MLDNALINIVAGQLEAASSAAGWNYVVLQKNQPSQEGVPSAPTIFFEIISDDEYGFPINKTVYQQAQENYATTDTQVTETIFQISALVPQDPTNLTLPTAKDVVTYMKLYLQSRQTVATFWASQISMMRVTSIRNPYFVDDKDRFEASPSFDITFQHTNSITMTVNAAVRAVGAPSPIPDDSTIGVFVVQDAPGEIAA